MGEAEVVTDGVDRAAGRGGGFVGGESAEMVEFDGLREVGAFGCEFVEGGVEREEIDGAPFGSLHGDGGMFGVHAAHVASTLFSGFGAGVVDQDAAHHLRGDGQEVRFVGECGGVASEQAHVGLVDQRRRLQRVSRILALQPAYGDAMQLAVDERDQFLGCRLVSVAQAVQQNRDARFHSTCAKRSMRDKPRKNVEGGRAFDKAH